MSGYICLSMGTFVCVSACLLAVGNDLGEWASIRVDSQA